MKLSKKNIMILGLFIISNINIFAENITTDFGNAIIDSETHQAIGQNYRQRFIILHYTALDNEKSIKVLTTQEVSSHYLITDKDEDPIYNLVPDDKRAWHAGASEWKSSKNLNDSSIGIEIVNLGLTSTINQNVDISKNNLSLIDESKKFTATHKQDVFSKAQIDKIAVLIKYLSEKYAIEPTNILGHSDIAPQRKPDPGPAFPWKELYVKYNIGIWYDDITKDSFMQSEAPNFDYISMSTIQTEFKKFGYPIEITNVFDTQTRNVIRAFQYRFRPSNFDGIIDLETYSILKALNEKYNKK